MKIVILGCGRVGARLAAFMEQEGHAVSIIDSLPDSFDRLPDGFKGKTTLGTGIDVDVLKVAGIEGADAFAAVTNFDNTNIMACQVAKEIFGVKKVLARIYDPGREKLYHELGLETICPTTLISTTARDILLAPEGVEVLDFPPHTEGMGGTGRSLTLSGTSSVAAVTGASTQPAAPPVTQSLPSPSEQPGSEERRGGLRGLFRH
jgi:trk system potassium uptake protein TrkA